MAGAGYKLFSTGDVLSASDVNTYLQQQTVMVFASAAARTTALASVLAEGMVTYLKDTDVVEIYTGAAWVSLDDPNAIQNSIVTAKGDLIGASAASNPARLAVGNNGETLVADSSTSTGLRYQGSYAAGKNAVINGAFDYWQRGTSFTNPADGAFTADRISLIHDGTGATRTISQQALAPATITGYDSRYYYRYAVSAAGTGNTYQRFGTKIENVQNLTGTITVSFWAKADASRTLSFQLDQYYGSGGSAASVGLQLPSMASVTTSWQRFSATGTLASISGKTVGDGSYVFAYFQFPANTTLTVDIAGFQIEQGSVATGFTRAAGTLQGELAACQRYYYKTYKQGTTPATNTSEGAIDNIYGSDGGGNAIQTFRFPVIMRTNPTITVYKTTGTSGSWDYSRSGASGSGAVTVDTFSDTSVRFYLNTGVNWTLAQTYGQLVASAEL